MARKKTPKRNNGSSKPDSGRFFSVIISIILLLTGLVIILALFNYAGEIGNLTLSFFKKLVGAPFSIIIAIGFITLSIRILFKLGVKWFSPARDLAWLGLIFASLGILGGLPGNTLGGIAGEKISEASIQMLDVFLGMISLAIIFILSIWFIGYSFFTKLREIFGFKSTPKTISVVTSDGVEEISVDIDKSKTLATGDEVILSKNQPFNTTIFDHNKSGSKEARELGIPSGAMATNYSNYTFPPLDLLKQIGGKPDVGNVQENVKIIHRTLKNFDIDVEMRDVNVGPTVSRYSLKPAEGVHLGRIEKLQDNLAMALEAKKVRIEAPIPGKSLVGIEVPNKEIAGVMLGSMLADDQYQNNKNPLLVSLGKSVSGQSYFADLHKMPHLLIAGATGSGKSITTHNIIVSLLYRNSPDNLRFIMIDPKRVELTMYQGIPHLLTPVVKDAKKAVVALNWAVKEMERRLEILEEAKVQNIEAYHKKTHKQFENVKPEDDISQLPERMPYIAIFIDEMSDLMTAYPRELEGAIVRLAQMARATGIHLILSTQRPSKKVVTGLIKANIPTRIALRVGSNIDSRVILDKSGAEDLLGKGDMLYLGPDAPEPIRMQCAFVSEEELKAVVSFINKNNAGIAPDEITLPDNLPNDNISNIDSGDPEDDLYDDALKLVVRSKKASTSYLQTRLRIGYSRASRLMMMLEENGIIGPQNGSKPRPVLISSLDDNDDDYADESDPESEDQWD